MRWKPALNAFAITFTDRMPASEVRNDDNATYTDSRTGPTSL